MRKADSPRGLSALRALLAAAFFFWLCRTALEKRVIGPARLFTFIEDGSFLAIPASLLAVSLLLAAFIFLTGPGRRLRSRLGAGLRTDGGLWLLSLLVTAVFLLWSLRVIVMSYMTNDDVFYLQAVVRVPAEGLGAAAATFSHILFGGMFGALYAAVPDGWWYIGYHLTVLTVSLIVIGRCLLLKTRRGPYPLLWGCVLHFALCGGFFLIAYAQISFTVTPAAAGSAAAALMLCRDELPTPGRRTVSDVGSAVLMLLCYMQRSQTGLALLCFWGLAAVYQGIRLLSARRGCRKQLIGLGATVLSVLVLIGFLRYYQTANPLYDADYWNAEYYRSMVMDYLGGSLTYEQYAEAGVPQELAVLLHGWYFMDERVTTDLFRSLVNAYYESSAGGSSGILAQLAALFGALRADPNMLYRALAGLAALLLSAAALLRFGRRCWLEFCCALAAFGGAFLMCLYLSAEGRFPLRAFLVPAFPAAVTILLMALSAPESAEVSQPRRRASDCIAAAAAAAFFVLCGLAAHSVPTAAEPVTRADLFTNQWVVEAYADKHPDVTFVTNMYADNLDPFHSPRYPENLVLWGAMGDTARAAEDRLYADAFFREDVRFLCQNPAYVSFLLQYLTLDRGPVAALDEAHLTDAIYVFDLTQIAPEDGADGWYDWNGALYYFEAGQAVSGERTIDGADYAFAAPGAASPMTVVSADEGAYFTTGAYRLLEGAAE